MDSIFFVLYRGNGVQALACAGNKLKLGLLPVDYEKLLQPQLIQLIYKDINFNE